MLGVPELLPQLRFMALAGRRGGSGDWGAARLASSFKYKARQRNVMPGTIFHF